MKKKIYLAAAALVLISTIGIGSAMAYFTTYVVADGGVKVSMGSTTTVPEEDVVKGQKVIQIKNEGDYECWVRIKVFAGSEHEFLYADESGKWTPGADDYYYYKDIVPVDGLTDELKVTITELLEADKDPEVDEAFNVIVVQECTPVLYDAEGNAYADWSVNAEILNKEVE